jgi:hypothetical protein
LGMFSDTIVGATDWCWMWVVVLFLVGRFGDCREGPHREESLCHGGGATDAHFRAERDRFARELDSEQTILFHAM